MTTCGMLQKLLLKVETNRIQNNIMGHMKCILMHVFVNDQERKKIRFYEIKDNMQVNQLFDITWQAGIYLKAQK